MPGGFRLSRFLLNKLQFAIYLQLLASLAQRQITNAYGFLTRICFLRSCDRDTRGTPVRP